MAPPPCLTTGNLTFGSFGSQYKLTDEVIGAWATILRRAPGSRLLPKNRALADASNRAALRRRFRCHDIPAERVLLDGPDEHRQFLAAYARIDIALDTFPYNGGTTTTEALWQGVPVLTFNGDRWVSRTSRSLLLAAGLGEWCAPDLSAYIERAIALAGGTRTPAEIAVLRRSMRSRLSAAPSAIPPRYAARLRISTGMRLSEKMFRTASSKSRYSMVSIAAIPESSSHEVGHDGLDSGATERVYGSDNLRVGRA